MQRKSLIVTAMVLAALTGCTKQGNNLFRGYYSFKTGGTIAITGKIYETVNDTVGVDTLINNFTIGDREFADTSYVYHIVRDTIGSRDTSFTRHLAVESGQMHVLDAGSKGNVKVTMNITGGNPIVMDGSVSGGTLTLEPCLKYVTFSEENSYNSEYGSDLTLSGTGRKYENMILFSLQYEGKYSYDGLEGNVTSSSINCIATENE